MNKVDRGSGHYDTHIHRLRCCERDPDLFAASKHDGFFRSGVWMFACSKCGKKGSKETTPNAASCGWNQGLAHVEGDLAN